jgi:hypothetical protein
MEDIEILKCTVCGNEKLAPILYGYPTPKWIEMAKLEQVALGGTNNVGFTHYCYSCNEVHPPFNSPYDE